MKLFLKILLLLFAISGLILISIQTVWWIPILAVLFSIGLTALNTWLYKKEKKPAFLHGVRGELFWNSDNSVRFEPRLDGKFIIFNRPVKEEGFPAPLSEKHPML